MQWEAIAQHAARGKQTHLARGPLGAASLIDSGLSGKIRAQLTIYNYSLRSLFYYTHIYTLAYYTARFIFKRQPFV